MVLLSDGYNFIFLVISDWVGSLFLFRPGMLILGLS